MIKAPVPVGSTYSLHRNLGAEQSSEDNPKPSETVSSQVDSNVGANNLNRYCQRVIVVGVTVTGRTLRNSIAPSITAPKNSPVGSKTTSPDLS